MTGDIPPPMYKIGTRPFPQCFILKRDEQTLRSSTVCMPSPFSHARPFETLWTVAHRLLCPWDSPGKNYWSGLPALLQRLFPTWGLNSRLLSLLHCRQVLYLLSQLGSHSSTYTSPKHLSVGGPRGLSLHKPVPSSLLVQGLRDAPSRSRVQHPVAGPEAGRQPQIPSQPHPWIQSLPSVETLIPPPDCWAAQGCIAPVFPPSTPGRPVFRSFRNLRARV